uniref:Uncharacterized protein n=1 Tax=Zea mays TaxID=4577 RepID=B4FW14_MAIZE|nr:unknown [Zea mays]ACR37056.1 unknown [Zea mays]
MLWFVSCRSRRIWGYMQPVREYTPLASHW